MKKIRLMIIVLALGVGIVDGCSESNRPAEKAAVTTEKTAVESPAKVPVEMKEPATVAVTEAVEKAVEETTAAASGAVEEAMKEAAASPIDIEKGASIFKSQCSACHGPGGRGSAMAPAFEKNDWAKTADKAEIAGVIKNGRQGPAKKYKKFATGMPAFRNMPDSDVNAVVEYIKSIN